MTILRIIDIETTGLAPPAEIIEIGRVDLLNEGTGWTIQRPFSRLYKPLHGISPETKAVHHITDEDIPSDAEPCTTANMRSAVMNPVRPSALVAHNCAFERTFITDAVTEGLPWICTYKCALQLWPEAPGHSNQILRYWRELSLEKSLAMPPHRAAPDAWVTAHLLEHMLKITTVEQLTLWTTQPKKLPAMPFGKHRNEKWTALPIDYLEWLMRQPDLDSDITWNVQKEIERRKTTG